MSGNTVALHVMAVLDTAIRFHCIHRRVLDGRLKSGHVVVIPRIPESLWLERRQSRHGGSFGSGGGFSYLAAASISHGVSLRIIFPNASLRAAEALTALTA